MFSFLIHNLYTKSGRDGIKCVSQKNADFEIFSYVPPYDEITILAKSVVSFFQLFFFSFSCNLQNFTIVKSTDLQNSTNLQKITIVKSTKLLAAIIYYKKY